MTESTTTMSCSEIPGVFEVDLFRDGLVVRIKSMKLFSLVGLSCQVEVN